MLGLQKIVLSNSIYRSKIVQIEVNGHTNLTGGNGAGKTSSLNLVPVFYGTDPNRLVLKVAGKVSFLDYYLPQQSSALIFEYLRDDGPRLAVLHRRTHLFLRVPIRNHAKIVKTHELLQVQHRKHT